MSSDEGGAGVGEPLVGVDAVVIGGWTRPLEGPVGASERTIKCTMRISIATKWALDRSLTSTCNEAHLIIK